VLLTMAVSWRVSFAEKASPSVADPPGYDATLAASSARAGEDAALATRRREAEVALKQTQAWAVAKSPAAQVPMVCFMMWMSGSGVQIFSIMVTLTNVASPVRAMLGSAATFARFSEPAVDVLLPRLLFCAIHCVTLSVALYKLDKMGLLPTHASDWFPNAPPLSQLETSVAGVALA
jgi:ER membrane protein complex subunit 4